MRIPIVGYFLFPGAITVIGPGANFSSRAFASLLSFAPDFSAIAALAANMASGLFSLRPLSS